jgi:hypothetical protein
VVTTHTQKKSVRNKKLKSFMQDAFLKISSQPKTFLNYRHDFAFKIFQKRFFLVYQKLFKNKYKSSSGAKEPQEKPFSVKF